MSTPNFLNRPLSDAEAVMVDSPDRAAQFISGYEEAEARLSRPDALGNAAAWYAAVLGWPVFPLTAGGKTPATSHGFKDATTDLDTIRGWWTANPAYNIGLATGHGFDVIDVDSPAALVLALHIGLPNFEDNSLLATATTPHGFHLYVSPTGSGNRAGMIPGVDYRGVGGYVVAPPSNLVQAITGVEGNSTVKTLHYRWDAAPVTEAD